MMLNNTPLFIGTSGYNHEDWKGTFAPKQTDNYDLLTYYADQGFNFLELAFTLYRMPEMDKIHHILQRTKDRVKFSVRMPKVLIRNPDSDELFEQFTQGIAPMVKNNLLVCLYADYHPSFSVSKKNQEQIARLRNRFANITFFAELHNRTWYKQRIFSYFKDNDIGLSVVDMPAVKGFAPYYPISTNHAQYYKLYGKNPTWLTSEEKSLDYNYSDEEMKKILNDAVQRSVTSKAIYIVFGNVAGGLAPKNALRMRELV